MKVLMVNGSPHKEGCTYTALKEVAGALEKYGIESEIFWVGNGEIAGCIGCGACAKTGEGCFRKDVVNEFVAKAGEADGYIFGSPVHYAAASGALTSFMDRAFYSGGSKMTGKPAAAVVSCRRGGASAAFDQINKYFTINCMPVVGSQYWNQVHGGKAEEVKQDEEKYGIESEIFWVGNGEIAGCIGCGACAKTGEGCFRKDVVNEFVAKAGEADGYIFGSPVHYAAASGALTSFMDRAFYSGGSKMTGKPAAAVVSCRRGGASAAFDQINKYFTINCMPVVGSQYWNQVHGGKAEEVKQDEEGMQTMRTLGNNMAWLLSCIEAGKEKGITFPEREPVIRTNYIR